MANYPFATIDPNVGMVEVPDKRLDRIQELIPAKKVVPTTFEFTDIAGIVKGASKGEGLGNKFLENIRQVDAIVHVVRAFDDDNITTVSGKVDPLDDIDTINLELGIADLDSVNKRLGKVQRAAKGSDKEAKAELAVLEKIKPVLEDGGSVRSIDFDEDEQKIVKGLFLLTSKPVLYVANIAEEIWQILRILNISQKSRNSLKRKAQKPLRLLRVLRKKLPNLMTMKKPNFWMQKGLRSLA